MKGKQFYVYIVTNYKNTVLYIGITSDLTRRIHEHKHRLVKGFTSKYNVNRLVYYEILGDPHEAIRREKQLKNLVRRKKDKIITDFNSNWKDLYEDIVK